MPTPKPHKARQQPADATNAPAPHRTRNVSIPGLQNETIDVDAMAQLVILLGRQLHAEANDLLPLDDRLEDQPRQPES